MPPSAKPRIAIYTAPAVCIKTDLVPTVRNTDGRNIRLHIVSRVRSYCYSSSSISSSLWTMWTSFTSTLVHHLLLLTPAEVGTRHVVSLRTHIGLSVVAHDTVVCWRVLCLSSWSTPVFVEGPDGISWES